MLTPAHRRSRGRPGAAAVEFAALLPFLLFLGVIAADWARLLHFTIATETCARNGALVLSDQTTWYQTSANPNAATPYPSGFCWSGTPALTDAQKAVVTAAAVAEDPTENPAPTVSSVQTTTDSAGNPTVTVTVSRTFTTIVSYPGVPSSQTVSRAVTMRVAPQGTN